MKAQTKKRNITYTGYAVTVQEPFDNNLIRIRPSKEAPESLAIFGDIANAEWFASHFRIDKKNIVPVVIVRTDRTEIVE